MAAPRARRGRQRGGRAVGEDEPGRGALGRGDALVGRARRVGPYRGDRGRLVGLGCGVGFSLFFPISLFPLLSILNLALASKFKINMLCEFKWRHNNSKHHTKLGAPACDATTIIPFGF